MVQISSVSCGNYHTIVLAADRQVFTFGSNCHGQLGVGHSKRCSGPQKVLLVRINLLHKHSTTLTAELHKKLDLLDRGKWCVICWLKTRPEDEQKDLQPWDEWAHENASVRAGYGLTRIGRSTSSRNDFFPHIFGILLWWVRIIGRRFKGTNLGIVLGSDICFCYCCFLKLLLFLR